MTWKIEWIDHEREPRVAPNPAYPMGKDIVAVTHPDAPKCSTPLPYPAKRCGLYIAECMECGLRIGVTTAGRPDDPRSLQTTCGKGVYSVSGYPITEH